jgi:ketosteroid isomerase-like protein
VERLEARRRTNRELCDALLETYRPDRLDEFSHELGEFRDAGDRFAVTSRMRGRHLHTGIETEMPTAGVCEVRDGHIVRIVGFSEPADALRAVER